MMITSRAISRIIWMALLFVLAVSANKIFADCTLPDDSNVQNCQEVMGADGELPNTLIYWVPPAVKKNGKELKPEDIEHSRVYFTRIHDKWWSNYTFEGAIDNSLYIYKPPETYSIMTTFFGDGGLESDPSDATVYDIRDHEPGPIDPPVIPPVEPPQPPTLTLTVSEGFSAAVLEGNDSTIIITPIEGGAE